MIKKEAFDVVYQEFREYILVCAYRKVHDYEAAEDICQDVFYVFYRKMETLDLSNLISVRRWLLVAMDLRVKDYYRAKEREENRLKKISAKESVIVKGCQLNPEETLIQREKRQAIASVLQELKCQYPDDYEMFHRVILSGEKTEKVAREYGISSGSLYTKICRMRYRLKEKSDQSVKK